MLKKVSGPCPRGAHSLLRGANRQTDRQQKHQKTATAGVGRDGESAEYMETEVVYLEE